ncbi:hypothetical protein D5039_21535 [Verminephrobacter aporrectodeae subsp. tuberculatae]|uniref:Uncharacterized protein n=1 Tax=Verminephrobacter aporrectodeae subsp. tuberculatae TaxID=1110392 RepID=A0ABT3KZ82_9BURK|nr:hypothetical protein [Verminephrobacter aporrectodeae]MCW5323634.1 hypothetical protein [Verminephrobacter aporrectodeae subsp. tuberculatae]
MTKTTAEYASDPSVAGLTGKARRLAIKALHDADKAAAPIAARAKLPSAKELARRDREYDQAFHPINVVRETDNAVAIKIIVEYCDFERNKTVIAWIPKSFLRDGAAPGWMLTKKLNEAGAEARSANKGSINVSFS